MQQRLTMSCTVRLVSPADAPAMAAFLMALEPAARRLRFHAGVNPQSDSLLRQLTQDAGAGQAAWVAVQPAADGTEQLVGEARYVCCGDGSAELALAVAAHCRGSGLADRLLAELTAHARAAGVRRLMAQVLGENGRMQAFMQRHGYTPALTIDFGLDMEGHAELTLVRELSAPPAAACGSRLRQRLAGLATRLARSWRRATPAALGNPVTADAACRSGA